MEAISVIGLFVLAVATLGGVLLVGLIAALAGSKNRSAAPIVVGMMLLLPLGIVCLLGVGVYFLRSMSHQWEDIPATVAEENVARAEAVDRIEQIAVERTTTSEIPVEVATSDEATAEASADAASAVADDGSAAPISASEGKPAWVDREEPFKDGSVYKWPLELELAVDSAEAEEKYLPGAVHQAIRGYIDSRLRLGKRAAARVRLPQDYIVENLIVETWPEPVHASTGDFVKLHVLLEFDRETNRLIEQRWAQHVAGERLWMAGGLLAFGLLWLASAFAYLRIDLATEGRYRRRLRFVAAAAILAVVLAGLAGLAALA